VRRAAVGLLVVLALGEGVARWGLGLGDPPLVEADPRFEYRYRPGQDLLRFGCRFHTNALGMRSEDWPAERAPGERRVLVLGDSVVAGGSLVDQQDLATERLARSLTRSLGAPVRTGNVAAASWGPPNLLAWVEAFGWLGADAVAIVVSSHDADDVPSFQPLDPRTQPTRRPRSALVEGLTVYLPRLWTRPGEAVATSRGEAGRALAALERLLDSAHARGRPVVLALHRERDELGGPEPEGLALQRALAEARGIAVLALAPVFAAAEARGERPYRDGIHPTALGQRLIADALGAPLLDALRSTREAEPPDPEAPDSGRGPEPGQALSGQGPRAFR